MNVRLLLGLLLILLMPVQARAHVRSESHTSWTVAGQSVRVDVSLPDIESAKLTPNGQVLTDAAFMHYFSDHLGATSKTGVCRQTVAPHMLSAGRGYKRAEYLFSCPTTSHIVLHFTGMFEKVPTHIDFAQIQLADDSFVEQLFTKDVTDIDLTSSNGGQLKDAGFLQFVSMGIMHIFTGVDHMSFLLGLVLLSRRLKDLLFVVTGFTIGHSLTLALAVTGIIRPHAEFIDALVALTIALVGMENIVQTQKKGGGAALAAGAALVVLGIMRLMGFGTLPPLLIFGTALFTACYLMVSATVHDMGRARLVVTMVFGLIHGFGFASDLLKDKLPAPKLAEILVGFNMGVEVGQVCVVLTIVGLVALLRKLKLATPRPITVDVVASCLVGIGVFWFIGRSF